MSHKKDRARAESGQIFRDGKLIQKSEFHVDPLLEGSARKTLERLKLVYAKPKVRRLK